MIDQNTMILLLLLTKLDRTGKYWLKKIKTKPQIQTAVNISEILDLHSKRMSKFRTLLHSIMMSITSKPDIQLVFRETALITEKYVPSKQMDTALPIEKQHLQFMKTARELY